MSLRLKGAARSRRASNVHRFLLLTTLTLLLAACGSQNPGTGTAASTATTTSATSVPSDASTGSTVAPAEIATAAPAETAMAGEADAADPLKVVATFSVLGDLVKQVGGDRIDLLVLVPAGGDAHTFEPSPTDSVALVDAAIVFENGLEFESWLPDLYTASRSQARRVAITEGIDLIPVGEGHADEPDDHADEQEHAADDHGDETATADDDDGHGEYDPHVWHDVANAMIMVENIRDALSEVDPDHAATYEQRAAAYLDELRTLDTYVAEQAATIPEAQRKLVTSHDTFAYFAQRYDFEVVGTALGSISTEVADPSAGDIAQLVSQIRETGVPAIFTDNIEGNSLMERIANEADVELGPQLYTDALGEPGSDGDSYLTMIRYNIDAITEALSS